MWLSLDEDFFNKNKGWSGALPSMGFNVNIGKAQKKLFFLVDSPLRGRGGDLGWTTMEKNNFLICSRLKIKNI